MNDEGVDMPARDKAGAVDPAIRTPSVSSFRSGSAQREGSRLYSATIMVREGDVDLVAFHASYASNESEIRQRLAERFGNRMADRATIRKGFDSAHPLVSAAVASVLQAGDGTGSGHRIDIAFEQPVDLKRGAP